MSERGASADLIADLVGHKDTATTWTVYHHQLRPVIIEGAELMNSAIAEDRGAPKGTVKSANRGRLLTAR